MRAPIPASGTATVPSIVPAPAEAAAAPAPQPARRRAAPPRRVRSFGRIVIPRIGVDVPVFEGPHKASLDHGPGHWYGTPRPGEPGNTVFSGHRTTYTRPFRRIAELRRGDRITFLTGGRVHTYVVFRAFVVELDDYSVLRQDLGTVATLFSCHPPGSSAHWYVVQARLVGTKAPRRAHRSPPPPSPTPSPRPGLLGLRAG